MIRLFFTEEHPSSRYNIFNLRNRIMAIEKAGEVKVETIVGEVIVKLETKGIMIGREMIEKTRTAASSKTDEHTIEAESKTVKKMSDATIKPKKLQIKPGVTGQKLKNLIITAKQTEDEIEKEKA